MKASVLIVIGMIASSSLLASSIVVKKVIQSKKFVSACERCMGEEVVTTTFKFTNLSCRKFSNDVFSVKVSADRVQRRVRPEKSVSIEVEPNLMDCRGINKRHSYKISTTEINQDERYILENNSILHISPKTSLPRVMKCSPTSLGKACMKNNETIGTCKWERFHYYPSCI